MTGITFHAGVKEIGGYNTGLILGFNLYGTITQNHVTDILYRTYGMISMHEMNLVDNE